MTIIPIAHIHEQGQDMIIVPLNHSFGCKSQKEQEQTISYIQQIAINAGLAGTVVPVWDTSSDRFAFLAPLPWHPFFKSLTSSDISCMLNRKLICS